MSVNVVWVWVQTADNVAPAKAARHLRAKYPLPVTRQSILGSNFTKEFSQSYERRRGKKEPGKTDERAGDSSTEYSSPD